MSLTHSDVRRVFEILDETSHLEYIEISIGDYLLKAGKTSAPPVANTPPHTSQKTIVASASTISQPATAPEKTLDTDEEMRSDSPSIPENMIAVRSPMAGTFYITPSPEEPPFVSEESAVAEGDTVCLVEVMKLFNSVMTPVSGKVHQIFAEHGKPVQLDQILMLIEPETSTGDDK